MWSVGAFLETDDRSKLEQQMRAEFPDWELPQPERRETVFDYFIDDAGESDLLVTAV